MIGNELVARSAPDEASRRFQASLAENPGDAEAHFRIGNLLAMGGRIDQAVAEWQASLRLRPANAEAHSRTGFEALWRMVA